MRQPPRLVPVAPTQGDATAVDRSPFWIGGAASAALKVYLPGIADRHASITEREDGFYLAPFSPSTAIRLDGQPVTGAVKLRDAAVIELGPAARYEFVTGEVRAKPKVEAPPEPVYEGAEPSRRAWWSRRRTRHRRRGAGFPLWGWALVGVVTVAMFFVGARVYRLISDARQEPLPPAALNQFEGQLYDELMVQATTHIERGATLLDLGLKDAAGRELAAAITTFDQSVIRDNPWVQQGLDAIKKTVEDLYRYNKLELPPGMRRAPRKTFDLSANLSANLNPEQFVGAVEQIRTAYRAQFRDTVVITGRDHPEHLSLYGKSSAMDVRVRGLRPDQVQFLIDGFGGRGIRVKDFSKDQVLQAQIQAAIRAGVPDRAGTGVHLHIDRYRDRSDRWTVRR